MVTRWVGVTLDCVDPVRLAAFWGALLGLPAAAEPLPGWARVGSLASPLPVLTFQPVAEPRAGKVRLHLDVGVDDIDAGMARVVALGGAGTGERHDYDEGVVVVMTDPEGHEFCLVQYFRGDTSAD